MRCPALALLAVLVTTPACATRTGPSSSVVVDAAVIARRPPSVVERHPELTADDSFDLDRVARAIAIVDRSEVAHVRVDTSAQPVWQPAPGNAASATHAAACPYGAPLSRFGALVIVRDDVGNTALDVAPCGVGGPSPTMPGLMWSVEGASAVFVTFDGGRYRVPLGAVVHGFPAAPSSRWDEGAHDALLHDAELEALSRRGGVPARLAAEVHAARAAWAWCSAPIWRSAVREYEDNDARVLDASTKERRVQDITARYQQRVDERCASEHHEYERALAAALEAHEIARRRVLELARSRFAR